MSFRCRAANHSIDFIPTWGPCEEEEEGGVRLLYKDLIHHNLLGNHHAAIGKEGKPAKAAVANFVNELLNKEQRAAVEAVVAGGPRNRPFILFGPAGTGKTLTLTEVILQALKQRPCGSPGQPRVLACAPTAFAADILCAGLARAGLKFGEMVHPLAKAASCPVPSVNSLFALPKTSARFPIHR